MIKSFHKIYPAYILTDLFFIAFSFILSYFFRYNQSIFQLKDINLPYFRETLFVFAIWTIFIVISFRRRNLYASDRGLSVAKEFRRVVLSLGYTAVLVAAVIFFAQYKFFSRQVFMTCFIMLVIFLGSWRIVKRLVLRRLIARGYHNLNVLIVGAGKMGRLVLDEIKLYPHWGFRPVGFLDDVKSKDNALGLNVLGKLGDFSRLAKKYFVDEVIITIPSQREAVSRLINQARNMHLGVRIVAENFEASLPVLEVSYLGMVPVITYKQRMHSPADFFLKRVLDFILALLGIIVLSPIFLVIALAVKIDSRGPVFYLHKRAGYRGRIFNFYKFRSMVYGADKMKKDLLEKNEVRGGVIFKIRQDPRITRVGRILRRFSLDELPQLFNVLKGDMSLVGPRPFLAEEIERFNDDQMPRMSMRPGLTGLAQIKGRSNLSFHRWIKWDLWYLNNWSFGLDLLILWRTIPVVLRGRGAY